MIIKLDEKYINCIKNCAFIKFAAIVKSHRKSSSKAICKKLTPAWHILVTRITFITLLIHLNNYLSQKIFDSHFFFLKMNFYKRCNFLIFYEI